MLKRIEIFSRGKLVQTISDPRGISIAEYRQLDRAAAKALPAVRTLGTFMNLEAKIKFMKGEE